MEIPVGIRRLVAWSFPLLLAACAGNMPVRTGYDRATGTWKPAPGTIAVKAAKKQKAEAKPAPDTGASTVTDAAHPDSTSVQAVADTSGRLPAGTVIKGLATYYGKEFAGRSTASGEVFDPSGLTCAHRTLPFGTKLKVSYPKKGTTVEVRVNDRGPQKLERVLDISRGAADELGLTADGVGAVEAEVLP